MLQLIESNNLDELKKYIDEKTLLKLQSNRHICHELNDGYLISFRYCNIENTVRKEDSVFIYFREDKLIFLNENIHINKVINEIDKNSNPAQQLFDFFITLTANDLFKLEEFEDKIAMIEDHLLTSKKLNTNNLKKIMEFRNKLLKIKRYYEQLEMILVVLSENRYRIFNQEIKEHFESLHLRVEKLFNFVLHLREYITQVREAYQAQIDIEQNNIMRIFTVITSIFLPLTLIVGWYGMNLQMPEYSWSYGYYLVIGLSVFISLLGFIIFKIKKWF